MINEDAIVAAVYGDNVEHAKQKDCSCEQHNEMWDIVKHWEP